MTAQDWMGVITTLSTFAAVLVLFAFVLYRISLR
jgi:hypothetical protein